MGKVPGTRDVMQRGPASVHPEMPVLAGEIASGEIIGGGVRDGGQVSSVFQVPTMLMRTLLKRARDTNLPLVLTEDFDRRMLRPDGIHQLSQVQRITERAPERAPEPGYYNWMRALVTLCLVDDVDGKRPYQAWLDFDEKIIGQMLEAEKRRTPERERFRVPFGQQGKPNVPPAPRWAGTQAFAPVYERARELAEKDPISFGQTKLSVRQVMATTEASLLSEAHVLRVEPDQVAVLPEWESAQEVFDYAADVVLPFEPLFLDFTAVGGFAPTVGWMSESNPIKLAGALVWRQAQDDDFVLMIAPYGWPQTLPDSFHEPPGDITTWESCGWFVYGAKPIDARTGEPALAGAVTLYVGHSDLHANAITCWADACAGIDPEDLAWLPGYAVMPFPFEEVRKAAHEDFPESGATVVGQTLVVWGEMIWRSAAKALAALSITEAVEVEIVDAPMEKRDYKRAVKRGWPIAQQVFIRSHSKRYRETNPPSGEEAHYSHRFWRRATVAHYPLGTRMADARPDLVTPCRREPERNCGYCRKVKRPPCIVGPEDKPLVLKTLVRRK